VREVADHQILQRVVAAEKRQKNLKSAKWTHKLQAERI